MSYYELLNKITIYGLLIIMDKLLLITMYELIITMDEFINNSNL